MLVRIGVQFSVKEARALVEEFNSLLFNPPRFIDDFPMINKLKNRLSTPLAEEIKVEAQLPQQGDTDA